jgi:20S proteasome subunit alpha 6
MFKNLYDNHITTWSPNGRLFQMEYAMEAVKQGSATVGVKSKTHAVIVALKRSPTTQLSSYQEKIFKLDKHAGMSVAGLIADGRYLASTLRAACIEHEYEYGTPYPVRRLGLAIADKFQSHTIIASKRPFGVGLLIAGYDQTGPQLLQAVPSGELHEFKATAMGSRSQSARTYLERHFNTFGDCTLDQLVTHALKALAATTGDNIQLNTQNTTIAIVGDGMPFTQFSDQAARRWLDHLVITAEDRVAAPEDDDDDDDEVQDA